MSIFSTSEIIIQISSIRSIDILSQGLFFLKFEISYSKDSEHFSALPYNIQTSSSKSQAVVSAPSIENVSYNSQIFLLKFFDEIVQLNEICFFRIQNELSLEDPGLTLDLVCRLMYIPAKITWNQDLLQDSCKNLQEFQEKACLEFTIAKSSQGFQQFLPIQFNSGISILINSCIYSFKSGYTFNKTPNSQTTEYSKLKLKDLKTPSFNESLKNTLFGLHQKITQNELLKIYEKLVITLAVYYENTKKYCEDLASLTQIREHPANLINLHEEIQKFNKNISENLNNSFIFVSIEDSLKLLGKGLWSISKNLSRLLEYFARLVQQSSEFMVGYLLPYYNEQQILKLNRQKVFTMLKCDSFQDAPVENHSFRHLCIVEEFRKSLLGECLDGLFVYPKMENHGKEFPIVFVDRIVRPYGVSERVGYEWMKHVSVVSKRKHLVVLVHGLYGNSMDMRIIRNIICTLWPGTSVLCSYYNEGKTGGDIEKMGMRLASEVKKYINDHFYDNQIEKLSFIGYSLGGLIARTSLIYLQDFMNNLHFLLTLSTPHLGCYMNTSKLIDAGMWIIKKLKGSKSLSQLALKDTKQVCNSFIYKLGSSNEIEHFKHVAFVSSGQDKYSPIYSSRVEVCVGKNSEKEKIQSEIANSILSKLTCNQLTRIDANFFFTTKNLDSAIGRAAHIEMIDNKHLIDLVLSECSSFFTDN